MHSYSDEHLMRLLATGDEAAFGELYERYGVCMHRYFYRMLGQDTCRAEDFTQELFLKLIEKRALYDAERRFSTWLYTVAGNMVKNEYRRISRIPELPEAQDYFEENIPETLDYQLFDKYLNAALDELDEVQRQCFVLRYQEELSLREIAEVVGCPEGTVKSRLFYTLKKLEVKLRGLEAIYR